MHPVESNTVGLYNDPVCVLDFASLYPSLFRAYNMSYDTLLHDRQDAKHLDPDQYIVTPTGKPTLRLIDVTKAFSASRWTAFAQEWAALLPENDQSQENSLPLVS